MPWQFKPQQPYLKVVPGETALAFYRAYNPSDKAVTGVSTYNVTPMRAGEESKARIQSNKDLRANIEQVFILTRFSAFVSRSRDCDRKKR